MRSPRAHRVGETLAGRYRLISPLGQGGYGAAFRAWDNAKGVPVVLKMPLAQHLDLPVILERFSREVARLRACSHANIVPIIDDGQDNDGRPFIVMRFLPGGSLADRKKPATLVTLYRWLPGIAAALDYIHSQGVLHRDVKPSNIFFDTQANAFLGDFGIARAVDDEQDSDPVMPAPIDARPTDISVDEESLTVTGQLMGTLPYMAPELFEERPRLSPFADQYSLAVAVYELLSKSWPVEERDRDAFRRFHRSGRRSTPLSARIRTAPVSLANAVAKALEKSPDDRFRSCREFAAAVLAEVPFTPLDPSHHRFLCPECKRLVRVPDDFGGRSCRCPNCDVTLRVTHDLDALWRTDEDPRTASSVKQSPFPAHPFTMDSLIGTASPAKAAPVGGPAANRNPDRQRIDHAKAILARPPLVNSLGMRLKLIPTGGFNRESFPSERPPGWIGRWDERTLDEKTTAMPVMKPFFLGVYQVTNEQWRAVMGCEPPSLWKDAARPVENVSREDAVAFCIRLSDRQAELVAGRVYRLPTAAEWEHACRAGTTTYFSFGNEDANIERYAWFNDNAEGETHPVGRKQPNAWGLYDMHGNVCEWVEMDWTDDDLWRRRSGIRGGSWDTNAQDCRSSYFQFIDSAERRNDVGFRIAFTDPKNGNA